MKTQVNMRPIAFSREMQQLADDFVPLVTRMLNDPDIVFTRPESLAYEVPHPEGNVMFRRVREANGTLSHG